MTAGRYWFIKVIFLVLAFFGVAWMMSSLQDGSYYSSPNSPIQLLTGPAAVSGAVEPSPTTTTLK